MKLKKVHLLIIDPQNDFCDIPPDRLPAILDSAGQPAREAPALPVPGADADMQRLGSFISRIGRKLYDIHVTMDSHHPMDIAHPQWWTDASGTAPAPFTIISVEDVRKGVWRARNPQLQALSGDYVQGLETGGRYALCIWPEHCLIGSWGHNIHSAVKLPLDTWARSRLEVIDYVTKGSNPNTEHYSSMRAEVPDPKDPTTMLNVALIRTLETADEVLIAGEALSHCVANTVRDIVREFSAENVKKLVLLTDCSSSVGGFETLGTDFVAEMTALGMRTALSTDYLA